VEKSHREFAPGSGTTPWKSALRSETIYGVTVLYVQEQGKVYLAESGHENVKTENILF